MRYVVWCCFFAFCLASCRESYELEPKSSEQNYLVVEGVLNSGQGPTVIKLTRTFKLDDTATVRPVLAAHLSVEGKDNTTVNLTEQGSGNYGATQLALTAGQEYRLRIKTPDGKEYLSEFVPVVPSPPIDSIGWKRKEDGLEVYVNTHNPTNGSRYYRWEYEETWEINSTFFSKYKYVNRQVLPRNLNEEVYYCWKNANSGNILLASTAQLQQDVIAEKPLVFIPAGSDKLSVRYSILARQYTLSKEAYEYYLVMKRNTESLGSIFDAQPSELRGNVRCVSNPQEPVIGFVTATAIQQKRIFINRTAIPWWDFRMICNIVQVDNNPDSIRHYFATNSPFDAVFGAGATILQYLGSSPACVDCTTRGGQTVRPSFW